MSVLIFTSSTPGLALSCEVVGTECRYTLRYRKAPVPLATFEIEGYSDPTKFLDMHQEPPLDYQGFLDFAEGRLAFNQKLDSIDTEFAARYIRALRKILEGVEFYQAQKDLDLSEI